MPRQTWGLDLGYWSLKVARGTADPKSGQITIDLFDEFRYDQLGVEEDAPSLERFREGLEAFGQKYTLQKGDSLCVAVSGSEVFSRFINLPPVPESIGEIIRYEARQQIPFDIQEVVWDYQPIKKEHQPGEEIEVGLFAVKREAAEELLSLLEPWRKNLRVIQDGPLALYNFLHYEGLVEEPLIVLDVGAHTCTVLILNPPRFWLRPLLIAGDDITERLRDHFGGSFSEAERIKARAGESSQHAQLLRVIRPVVSSMVSEIQRSLGYYKSLARGVRFERVLALGGSFKLSGLDRLLAEGLQYQITPLTELKRVQLAPNIDPEQFSARLPGAGTAIGLVVQGCNVGQMGINLVPEEVTTALEMSRKKPWVAGAAAAVLVMGLALLLGEGAYASRLKAVAEEAKPVNMQITSRQKPYTTAKARRDAEEAKLKDFVVRTTDRDLIMHIIPMVSQELPDKVFVRSFSLSWAQGKLVLSMACETDVVAGAREYIDEAVQKHLEELLGARTGKKVFSSVQVSTQLVTVPRDIKSGAEVPGAATGARNPNVKDYVAFSVTAVVETGGTAAATGSRRN